MTNEQLTAYLQDESYLYSIGYEELKTLVMQYPYSANLRILLLKKSYLEQNKDYDRNLQMSATYSTNRKHLYRTIKKIKSFKLAPQNVILSEDFLELTELSNIERLLAERQVSEAVQTATSLESLSSDWQFGIDEKAFDEKKEDPFDLSDLSQNMDSQDQKTIDEDAEIDSLIENLTTDFDNTNSPKPKNTLHFYSDDEDIKDDDDIIIDEELKKMAEKEKKIPALNIVEDLAETQNIFSTTTEKELTQEVKKTHIKLEITHQTHAPIVEKTVTKAAFDSKPTFTEWLSQFRMTQSQTANGVAKETKKTTQSIVSQPVKSSPIPELVRKTSIQSMGALFESKNDVPDNLFGLADETPRVHFDDDDDDDDDVFSEDETTFKKRKKLRPMHQLAAKSLVNDDDLVSETLADLLVWQGNGEKAKEMYRKLILRFPEKSSYFAAKIEKIKE